MNEYRTPMICEVCGLSKTIHVHDKCSKIKQQKYKDVKQNRPTKKLRVKSMIAYARILDEK